MDAAAWGTWALAIGTFVLAGAAVWTGWQTRASALAARRTVDELQRDRDLSWQPYLVAGTQRGFATLAEATVTNIGRGPALNCVYAERRANQWARTSPGTVFALAPNEQKKMYTIEVEGRPPPALFESERILPVDRRDAVGVMFCQDVLGDKLFRFVSYRPGYDVWRASESPPLWAQDLVALEPVLRPRATH